MSNSRAGIAAARLRAQHLVGEPFSGPAAAIARLGAVQSQDYGAAKWALGLRSESIDAEVDRLLDDGAILRTHVLRPTWHFVLPEDAGWLLDLTAPRIRKSLVARYGELELDAATVARAAAAFAAALRGGRHLLRAELADVLLAEGISPAGQRLPHLLMGAELDRVLISGRRRERQMTYALYEERAPKQPALDREEALARLTLRYFEGHGPAQVGDLVWWSGLTVADVRAGIAMAGDALQPETVDGVKYWSAAGVADPVADVSGTAHLLPNYDEYLVGFRDRSAALDPGIPLDSTLFSLGSVLSNVLTVGGCVRGSWRRADSRRGIRISLRLMAALNPAERVAAEGSARRMGRFLERPVEIDLGDRSPRDQPALEFDLPVAPRGD